MILFVRLLSKQGHLKVITKPKTTSTKISNKISKQLEVQNKILTLRGIFSHSHSSSQNQFSTNAYILRAHDRKDQPIS